MRRKSQKGKFKEHRGTGTGADYKPWIQTGEFGSRGTAANPIDWKTGMGYTISADMVYPMPDILKK